jgi:hypothetical protein
MYSSLHLPDCIQKGFANIDDKQINDGKSAGTLIIPMPCLSGDQDQIYQFVCRFRDASLKATGPSTFALAVTWR